MNAVLSLLLRCLSLLGVLVAANVVAPSTAWGYDAQPRPSTAYDGASLSAFDYDSASVLAIREKQNGATGNRVLFAKFAEFVAAKSGPVVIGETMTRVEAAAAKYPGAKILNDMPDFRAMGMNPDQVTSAMMQYNRKWILEQMRSGRQIIDIGADVNRARPSIFYEMEQNMLKNYQKLHPEFNGVTHP